MICETDSMLKKDPFKAPNKSQKVLSYFRCLKIPKDMILSARKCQNVREILYCQNPNLTTTQPKPNLNLVGFDMIIIAVYTTPPHPGTLLLLEIKVLVV